MKIKIIKVSDSLLWYNGQIGQVFIPYREYDDSYLVRCPDGLSNIVYKTDCEQVNEIRRRTMNERIEKVVDGVTYIGRVECQTCTGCVGVKDSYLCGKLSNREECTFNWSEKVEEQPIKIYSSNPEFVEKLTEKIEGVKYDQDKIKYSLLPSYALEAAAKNMTCGLQKYPARNNWMLVDNAQERYLDALYRHLEAHRRGDIYDTESSDPTNTHLAAVVVNAMFLLEFLLNPELKGKN